MKYVINNKTNLIIYETTYNEQYIYSCREQWSRCSESSI